MGALHGEPLARRAQEIYDNQIRQHVEPDHIGEFLVIDADTGEYVYDADDFTAGQKACEQFPNGSRFAMRIGYATMYTFGGRMRRASGTA